MSIEGASPKTSDNTLKNYNRLATITLFYSAVLMFSFQILSFKIENI